MAVNPMLVTGANGMQRGIRELRDVAQDVSELNVRDNPSGVDSESVERGASNDQIDDAAQALVDLKLYQRQVQASAQVVKTADEVLGFLLDVHA
jgi:hypothetical protein